MSAALLDHASIVTNGGIVLWQKTFPSASTLALNSIDNVIRNVLIESVNSTSAFENKFESGGCNVHWELEGQFGLIFLVAYPRILNLSYITTLLQTVKALFLSLFGPIISAIVAATSGKDPAGLSSSIRNKLFGLREGDWDNLWKGWNEAFDRVRREVEANASANARRVKPRTHEEVKALKDGSRISNESSDPVINAETIAKNVAAFKARQKGSRRDGKGGGSGSEPGSETDTSTRSKPQSNKKIMRKWDDTTKLNEKDMAALDYSVGNSTTPNGHDTIPASELVDQSAVGNVSRDGIYQVADFEYSEDEGDEVETTKKAGQSFFGRLQSSIGLTVKPLTHADLKPVLANMREHLMTKNVAKEVAETICDSVGKSLEGKKIGGTGLLGSSTVRKEVKKALESSLTTILTPKTSTDILLEISRKRSSPTYFSSAEISKEPYTMTFVGVNGVGKSTNLSKVAFWLLKNNLRVLIAACDTFRSGAVEQLRVHVKNLGKLDEGDSSVARVELFEKGYGKDAAGIAKDAVTYATEQKFDVVLIDTAGRMQDNEPLMRALAKLITVNKPDKVIFVGEALVGNEAVDQLNRFDKSLRNFSGLGGKARGIDGIILTKFDTIDDKVGAAVSMSFTTGAALLFIGVGQTYSDLKTLRVQSIVNALLAGP